MLAFFQSGGVAMFFVVSFGLLAMAASVWFALRPDARKIEAVKSLSIATALSVFAGVAADLAAVGHNVPNHPEWAHSPDVHLIVMQGISESMSPAILGCSMLAVAWMVMAVGHRRRAPLSESAS